MAKMNGNIGTVTVSVGVDLEPSEQFDAVAKMLGYVKKRTCHFRNDGHGILWCDAQGCDYDMDDYLPIPKYCPNCGAKVVE